MERVWELGGQRVGREWLGRVGVQRVERVWAEGGQRVCRRWVGRGLAEGG
jgi:hypothetical protein